MPFGLWYVTALALGAGASIVAFWSAVAGGGRLGELLPGMPGARGHAVAELLTGGLLLGSGAALLVDHQAGWARTLTGLALGGLLYALTGSPGLYPRRPRLRAAFALGWLFTIPAIVFVFLDA